MTVHVVGSINIDIIARVEQLPRPGETILALGTERLAGGKGGTWEDTGYDWYGGI